MMWKVCLHILGLCSTIECCMKCDKETMGVYGALKNEYIDRNVRAENDQDMDRALAVRKKMRNILDHGLQVSLNEVNVYPYIDDATLNQLGSAFRSRMNRTMATDITGDQLMTEIVWLLQELNKKFTDGMSKFKQESLCPNTCGLLLQDLINCGTCERTMLDCSKGAQVNLNCGEKTIAIDEGGDVSLDCGLPWHRRTVREREYKLYKIVNSQKELQATSDDSVLAKRQVLKSDEGSYECYCQNRKDSTNFSIIHFKITVTEEETTTEVIKTRLTREPLTTLPAKLSQLPQEKNPEKSPPNKTLVMVIVAGVVLLVCITIACVYMYYLVQGEDPILEHLERKERERVILEREGRMIAD